MRQVALGELKNIHADVDRKCAPLAAEHAERLQCRKGCSQCCVDGLTVFSIEADRIRRHCQSVLDSPPHPPGACAFLAQDGSCRIYAHRPYVCRTQGLPLRWLDMDDRGDWLEYRDICPLNDTETPLTSIDADSCWTLGPIECELADLQARTGSPGERIALRDLFSRSGSSRDSFQSSSPGSFLNKI